MLKNLFAIISIPLVIIHLFILYFWIFDWEKLVMKMGQISWIGSILLGIVFYLAYHYLFKTEKNMMVSRIVFCSTLITIVLGVLALLIELATSLMP
ncbi:hypothetical protein [Niallia sp. 01092]|uniref:hypothetical protein n=1 Tax=unclassified Niallia TaxID=2837522 RepID=UPI003FD15DB8